MTEIAANAAEFLILSDDALLAQCETDRFRASGPGGQKRNKTDSAVRLRHRPTGLSAMAVESRSQHQNRAKALARLRKTIALSVRSQLDWEHYEPSPTLQARLSANLKSPKQRRIEEGTQAKREPRQGLCSERQPEGAVQPRDDADSLKGRPEHGANARPGQNSGAVRPVKRLGMSKRDPLRPQVWAELLDALLAAEGRVSALATRLGISTANLVSFFQEDPKLWVEVNRIRQRFHQSALKMSPKR